MTFKDKLLTVLLELDKKFQMFNDINLYRILAEYGNRYEYDNETKILKFDSNECRVHIIRPYGYNFGVSEREFRMLFVKQLGDMKWIDLLNITTGKRCSMLLNLDSRRYIEYEFDISHSRNKTNMLWVYVNSEEFTYVNFKEFKL
jgi:hypothetical protein